MEALTICKHCESAIKTCTAMVEDRCTAGKGWVHIQGDSHFCGPYPSHTTAEPGVSLETRTSAALDRLDTMLEIVEAALATISPYGPVAEERMRCLVHERNNLQIIRTILKGEA